MSCKNSGFTIIEIFVIIAIIFILAAVIFPRYVDFENQNRCSSKRKHEDCADGCEAYATNNNGDYPIQPDDAALEVISRAAIATGKIQRAAIILKIPLPTQQKRQHSARLANVKQTSQLPPADLGGSRMAGKIFYNAIVPAGQSKALVMPLKAPIEMAWPLPTQSQYGLYSVKFIDEFL